MLTIHQVTSFLLLHLSTSAFTYHNLSSVLRTRDLGYIQFPSSTVCHICTPPPQHPSVSEVVSPTPTDTYIILSSLSSTSNILPAASNFLSSTYQYPAYRKQGKDFEGQTQIFHKPSQTPYSTLDLTETYGISWQSYPTSTTQTSFRDTQTINQTLVSTGQDLIASEKGIANSEAFLISSGYKLGFSAILIQNLNSTHIMASKDRIKNTEHFFSSCQSDTSHCLQKSQSPHLHFRIYSTLLQNTLSSEWKERSTRTPSLVLTLDPSAMLDRASASHETSSYLFPTVPQLQSQVYKTRLKSHILVPSAPDVIKYPTTLNMMRMRNTSMTSHLVTLPSSESSDSLEHRTSYVEPRLDAQTRLKSYQAYRTGCVSSVSEVGDVWLTLTSPSLYFPEPQTRFRTVISDLLHSVDVHSLDAAYNTQSDLSFPESSSNIKASCNSQTKCFAISDDSCITEISVPVSKTSIAFISNAHDVKDFDLFGKNDLGYSWALNNASVTEVIFEYHSSYHAERELFTTKPPEIVFPEPSTRVMTIENPHSYSSEKYVLLSLIISPPVMRISHHITTSSILALQTGPRTIFTQDTVANKYSSSITLTLESSLRTLPEVSLQNNDYSANTPMTASVSQHIWE